MQDTNNLLTISNAKVEDADTAAILMDLAFEDFSIYLFGTDDHDFIMKTFKNLWMKLHNRFSYRFCFMMRDKGNPIGLISCYQGEFINKMFIPSLLAVVKQNSSMIGYILKHPDYLYALLTSTEAFNDEFYVFVLAVLPEYQKRGIGTKLLQFAESKAKEQGFKKLTLLVSMENYNAIKFYEGFGMHKTLIYKRKPMHYYKMVKELN